MATKKEKEGATEQVEQKPTASVSAEQLRRDREQVTAIACALLQSPGFSIKLRDEQHQAHLVKTAMQIAEKINAAVNA